MPKIKWEVLQDKGNKEEYAERRRQLWEEAEWDNHMSVGQWEKVSEVMLRAAKEVCGKCMKR